MEFWGIYWKTFLIVNFLYALVAATSRVFYEDKPVTQLSFNEMDILNGNATFGTRLSVFIHNTIAGIIHIPGHIISLIVTSLIYIFT